MTNIDRPLYDCEPIGSLCHIGQPAELGQITHDLAKILDDPPLQQPMAEHLLQLTEIQGVTAAAIGFRQWDEYFGLEYTALFEMADFSKIEKSSGWENHPLAITGEAHSQFKMALRNAGSKYATWMMCTMDGAEVRIEGEGAIERWHRALHYQDQSDSAYDFGMGLFLPTDPYLVSLLVELIAPDGEPRATAQLYQMTDESATKYELFHEARQEDQSELP